MNKKYYKNISDKSDLSINKRLSFYGGTRMSAFSKGGENSGKIQHDVISPISFFWYR